MADPKSNLAILLVPGSFTPTHYYTHVCRSLQESGNYAAVQAVPLMSACKANEQRQPPATLEADTFYIREVLQALLAKGHDVIMVMNSYGGFPGTQALQGLPSRGVVVDACKPGEQGSVVGLVYLSSFLPFPGDSLRSMMGDTLFEPLKSGDPGNYMYLPAESGPGIFSDWAADGGKDKDIEYWFGEMTTHSSDSFDGKVTHDLWADGAFQGKALYVIGEKDAVVQPGLSESMIEKVNKVAEGKVAIKRVPDGGHVMHVTRPQAVVDAVEEVIASLTGN
jgi:pimeloyl-ACP methyl ester carboxylesterase